MPNEKEFKVMIWMAVAGGSSGIAVFSWNGMHRHGLDERVSCPPFPEVWKQVSSVITELAGYTGILLGAEKTLPMKIEHDRMVGTRVYGSDGSTYLLAVNGDMKKNRTVTVQCSVPVKVLSVGLGHAEYRVNGKMVTISLKPLECILLRMTDKKH